MRMRRTNGGEDAEVMLSPMIDCIFLLLIFFLVTSMIKRFERQIPVSLADPTAAVEQKKRKDVFEVAIDKQGRLFAEAGLNGQGATIFSPAGEASVFFPKLARERGASSPLQVNVDPDAEWQRVIRVQDQLEDSGFRRIMFRSSDRPVAQRMK